MRATAMIVLALGTGLAMAQVPGPPVNVTTTPGGKPLAELKRAADQQALLKSSDPKLARNKKHVFDFWRIVMKRAHGARGGVHDPEYIQHNPTWSRGAMPSLPPRQGAAAAAGAAGFAFPHHGHPRRARHGDGDVGAQGARPRQSGPGLRDDVA